MAVPLLLFMVALAARALFAAVFAEPAYPDALYYANLARALAEGRGFEVDYIWNFVEVGGVLPEAGRLPIPSNAHWMPLAALVQVPFIWLLGPTPLASGLPFWLASAAVAPLTWSIGRDAGVEPWLAASAGLLVAIPGALAPYLGQPDNFAIFMLLGASALWLCARGMRGDRRSFALGGVVVGLAVLSRTDGILLGLPFALAAIHDLARAPRGSRIGWLPTVACVLGFLLVVTPWFWRQLDVFGSLTPSASSGRILWISEYRELFSVTSEATPASFLEQGLGGILWSRLGGLAIALVILATLPLLFLLTPLLVAGVWSRRADPSFIPWMVYAVALLAFTAIVSAVHVPYGTFIHSAVALVPHAYLLALVGLAGVVRWIAARRPSWDGRRAVRNITAMVVGAVVLGSAGAALVTTGAWKRERDGRTGVLAALASLGAPGDRVMSPDPGAYRYHGGWSGIVTPDDPLPVVEAALGRYGVRWLALEADHITEALVPVLTGEVRPAWLSPPVVLMADVADSDTGTRTDTGTDTDDPGAPADGDAVPRAALYAVCLARPDARCSS